MVMKYLAALTIHSVFPILLQDEGWLDTLLGRMEYKQLFDE